MSTLTLAIDFDKRPNWLAPVAGLRILVLLSTMVGYGLEFDEFEIRLSDLVLALVKP
jgi:hypothetical protein